MNRREFIASAAAVAVAGPTAVAKAGASSPVWGRLQVEAGGTRYQAGDIFLHGEETVQVISGSYIGNPLIYRKLS